MMITEDINSNFDTDLDTFLVKRNIILYYFLAVGAISIK